MLDTTARAAGMRGKMWPAMLLAALFFVVPIPASAEARPGQGTDVTSEIETLLLGWDDIGQRARRIAFVNMVEQLLAELERKASDSEAYPYNLYVLQVRTTLLAEYALDQVDYGILDRILHLLSIPSRFVTRTESYRFFRGGAYYYTGVKDGRAWAPLERPSRMWVDKNGTENILASSQFLWLVGFTISHTRGLPRRMRQDADRFVRSYAPLLLDHYRRWVLEEPGPFQVAGWGCTRGLFNHREFLAAKLARRFGRTTGSEKKPSYCDAVTDTDLWILAGVVELLAAHERDPGTVPLDPELREAFGEYVRLGARLVASRLVPTNVRASSNSASAGLDFDPGAWRDHPDMRYSGYRGDLFPEDNGLPPMRNLDFEIVDPALHGWTFEGAWMPDSDRRFNGRASAKVRISPQRADCLIQEFAVTGRRYIAFAHVRGAPGTAAVLTASFPTGRPEVLAETRAQLVFASEDLDAWRRIELEARAPARATRGKIRICMEGPGTANVDAVRLVFTDTRADKPRQMVPPQPGSGSWDLSHARRFVQVFRSFAEHADVLANERLGEDTIAALARQIAYAVFDGDFAHPRFRNFFDGSDGWYRVNYNERVGFAYAPGQMSGWFATSGYCRWERYEPRLARICDGLWEELRKEGRKAHGATSCYVQFFRSVPCRDFGDRVLAMLVTHGPATATIMPGRTLR